MASAANPAGDARWMRMALGLAARSLGRVAPNPAVGAVIVRDGRVLGRGATAPGGRPHAEALALAQARERYGDAALAGATAFVSLEPCAHHGQTPPCAEALAAAGISRVVSPVEDPDPRVSGRGFAALRQVGIAVETGLMAAEARRLNAGFLTATELGRPFLTLKLAVTLDGRIATRMGDSRWITGPEARRRVHLMRAKADAVLVGAGTARADDPMLDVRGLGSNVTQPVRVVADGSLSLPEAGQLAQTARTQPVHILHHARAATERRSALGALGVTLAETPADEAGLLDLTAAIHALATAGLTRVLCEGGGRLAAGLLAAGLTDEIVIFTAGRAIGGDGLAALASLGLDRLTDAPDFEVEHEEIVGDDVMMVWHRRD